MWERTAWAANRVGQHLALPAFFKTVLWPRWAVAGCSAAFEVGEVTGEAFDKTPLHKEII